jgi:uncharacterized protein YuzE
MAPRLTKAFTVAYDKDADAAYIHLRPIAPGDAVSTISVHVPHGSISLDIDREGRVIGIEILQASAVLPASVLS